MNKVYLFIGCFLLGLGSVLIHPGLCIMVIGIECIVFSYAKEESNSEGSER